MNKNIKSNLIDEKEKIVDAFKIKKENDKVSLKTIEKYLAVILRLYDFIAQKGYISIQMLNEKDVLMFVSTELNGSLSIYSRKFITNTVKMFIRFLCEHEGFSSQFISLETIKVVTPEVAPKEYPDEVLLKIEQNEKLLVYQTKQKGFLQSEAKNKKVFYQLRTAIIFAILRHIGVKQEELNVMRLCDIELFGDGRFYHIHVKRSQRGERVIPLARHIIEPLWEPYKSLCNSEFICSTFEGRQMARREIELSLKSFFKEIGEDFLGIQAFRHMYARSLINDEYSLERMKYLLGYRNTRSVIAYIKIFNPDFLQTKALK